MILMTGPNYSGKSVYLKQVAMITYMAHIGCFVPAEAAKIGLTDKILTRIATRESVSRIQSAFMIDLQQTSIALTLATRRSLVIIDEFGKGTDTHDGAGLAAGVFEHFLQLGPKFSEPHIFMKYLRMASFSLALPCALRTWKSMSTQKPAKWRSRSPTSTNIDKSAVLQVSAHTVRRRMASILQSLNVRKT